MSPNDGAIEDQVFHVRVIHKVLVHLVPDPVIAPAGKAFVDAIPVAVLVRQQSPLSSAAGNPQHPFHKTAAGGFLSNIGSRAFPQKLNDFAPLFIFDGYF